MISRRRVLAAAALVELSVPGARAEPTVGLLERRAIAAYRQDRYPTQEKTNFEPITAGRKGGRQDGATGVRPHGVGSSVVGLAACVGAAAQPVARSGTYEGLTLAVAGHAVAGVFAERRGTAGPGGGPQFGCVFLLRGTLAGDRATVETWYPGAPERIAGELAFTRDGAALMLSEDHGGCPMTTGSMAGSPYALSRNAGEAPAGWLGAGLITARRTAFRPEPGPASPRAPYLVRSDPVAILERREGWVRARYQSETAPVTGWLPVADLAVVLP